MKSDIPDLLPELFSNDPAIDRVSGAGRSELLKARAKVLARIPETPVSAQAGMDVIVFTLAMERFGIETIHVREVLSAVAITPVPCTPRYMAGVINVRGDIIAVFDLKIFFEFPVSRSPTVTGEVIIVEVGDSVFGVLADSAEGVFFVPLADLKGTLPLFVGRYEESLKGVTAEHLIVLDMPRILVEQKLWIHEEVSV